MLSRAFAFVGLISCYGDVLCLAARADRFETLFNAGLHNEQQNNVNAQRNDANYAELVPLEILKLVNQPSVHDVWSKSFVVGFHVENLGSSIVKVSQLLGGRQQDFERLAQEEARVGTAFLDHLAQNRAISFDMPVPAFICRYFTSAVLVVGCKRRKSDELVQMCKKGLVLDARLAEGIVKPRRNFAKAFLRDVLQLVLEDPACVPKRNMFFGACGGTRPWVVPVLGPSAAGKSFASEFGLIPELFAGQKAALLIIDGGHLRTAYSTYTTLINLQQRANVTLLSDLFPFFHSSTRAHKKALFQFVNTAKPNVVLPDTDPEVPWVIDVISPRRHLADTVLKMIHESGYAVSVAGVYASRQVTYCQGRGRELKDSKKYDDTAWAPSVLSLQNFVKRLKDDRAAKKWPTCSSGHELNMKLIINQLKPDFLKECLKLADTHERLSPATDNYLPQCEVLIDDEQELTALFSTSVAAAEAVSPEARTGNLAFWIGSASKIWWETEFYCSPTPCNFTGDCRTRSFSKGIAISNV